MVIDEGEENHNVIIETDNETLTKDTNKEQSQT